LSEEYEQHQRNGRGSEGSVAFLDMDAAIAHWMKGLGIWDWASNDQGMNQT
jgi:phosphoketolase